jgi:adenine-specific DNA-methyltransferase
MIGVSDFLGDSLDSKALISYEKEAVKSMNSAKSLKPLYPMLLESLKPKQQCLGQFHTRDNVVDIVLGSLPQDYIENLINGAKIVDPSCGTANFLVAIAHRIISKLRETSNPKDVYKLANRIISRSVFGFEIDPTLAKAAEKVFEFEFEGKIESPRIYTLDALDLKNSGELDTYLGSFDYVVGNPPWVEVKRLPDSVKLPVQEKFKLSNLYGAFVIQGANFLKPGGHLSYVIPRSFTGGRYYSRLREFLSEECSIESLSYYSKRRQQFYGGEVLQELVVISFSKAVPSNDHKVRCVPCPDISDFRSSNCFFVRQNLLFSRHDQIMLLADSSEQFEWMLSVSNMKNFEEQGFGFSTGQLVLHRAKDFLRDSAASDAHRIIYTHDILNASGHFDFQNEIKRVKDRSPYAVLTGKKNFDGRNKHLGQHSETSTTAKYLNKFPEVIVCRRRSHKGDKRRFVGVYLSQSDLPEGGYFLENGLNYIYAKCRKNCAPSLKALYRILRSDLFENFFEIVSSNTQINKNDMFLFGIPEVSPENQHLFSNLEQLDPNNCTEINEIVDEIYLQRH